MDLALYSKLLVETIALGAAPLLATQRMASEDFKTSMAKFLMQSDVREIVCKLPILVEQLFTTIYGKRHISWKCVSRSAIASVVLFSIVFGLLIVHPSSNIDISTFRAESMLVVIVVALVGTVLLNLFPDYLSLLQTRMIVRRMADTSISGIVGYLVFDILITFCIFAICVELVMSLAEYYDKNNIGNTSTSLINYMLEAFDRDSGTFHLVRDIAWWQTHYVNNDGSIGSLAEIIQIIFLCAFVTTFANSVWVWLIATTSLLISFVKKVGGQAWDYLFKYCLDTKDKPFDAMAYVWSVFVIIIYTISSPFVLLLG